MKQLISRIKHIGIILVWDLITAIALFFLLFIVVSGLETEVMKAIAVIVTCCFVFLMMFMKYQLLYKQYGRDDVTGGKNKKEFERIARDLLRGDGQYVMVYANVDRFKLINEAYGNSVGDMILREIQTVIDEELRWDEVSGRIMADNFGILMRFHSIEKLEQSLSRISKRLSGLSDEDGNEYGIILYFGICVIEDNEAEVSALLEHANLARKKIAPSHLVPMGIYDEKDRERLSRDKELEMKMHQALEHGDFIPYLQPKYELQGETVAGAEALVRWVDPEEGMIYPNEFIPLFEKNGFVVEIDLYMFEQVCKLVEKWVKEGQKLIPISVNLSRSHFEIANFFDKYEQLLKKYNIPPKAIEIELTESLFYNDMSSLNTLVNKIHQAGLSCSIDDFGSGYSSLNMLKDVKVDALKLDRVFFASGEDDKRGKDVIQSVIRLAQALDLRTISEGVEKRNQVEFLKQMHCDLIQGYVFAKPMPIQEFECLAFGAK
ncbi:MAG: bifunctional diguanylate cyclase/phosphodiesterase [Lachnospiraceae bacterium]|nr:bifunctional diguanylate cyclase/phosphodiesterase [Lachnospiraceae bacterium]